MDCQDRVRDKIPANASQDEVVKHKGELEQCVIKCADSHIALVPALMKRMKEVLNSK